MDNHLYSTFLAGCFALMTALSTAAPEATPESSLPASPEADAFQKLVEGISWKTEGTGNLGSVANFTVPQGYRFTESAGTIQLMEAYGNLTGGGELGYVSPLGMEWCAVFEFDDCGYVKDDEKDKLDANEILDQLKEGQEAANEELTKRGMSTLTVLGWQTPPFYNPATNNLEWAILLRSNDSGTEILNYKTKLLGRSGVMDVVLICSEAELPKVIPEYQNLLKGFAFKKDQSYAAYTKGDKIAEYGLTGLIVGGGLLVAAKSGLLTKLFKPLIIAAIAFAAFFKRIFRGKSNETI